MANDSWDPGQYEKFLRERSAPFFDLVDLVRKRPGMRVIDLGCGTGELTRRLHEALSAAGPATTVGVDSSTKMLEKAAGFVTPGLAFERGTIEAYTPAGPVDLVFSNAALHFVPGHEPLLARLASWLAPGGQLAVHIPANQDHPTHRSAHAVAGEPPFREALDGYRHPTNLLPLEAYAEALHRLGFGAPLVRLNVYTHLLEGRESVVEWVKGSILTEYQSRMPAELYPRFLARYAEVLLPRLSAARPFFFTFKRVLVWAQT